MKNNELSTQRTLVIDWADQNRKVDLKLNEGQRLEVARRLSSFDLATIGEAEIVQIGLEDGAALKAVLDDFLSRVDTDHGRTLYDLCERISEGVEQADLASLRDQILSEPQLAWWQRIWKGARQAAQSAAKSAYDQAVSVASERTVQLNNFLNNLEGEVEIELSKLRQGVLDLQGLKDSYRTMTSQFAISVGVAQELRQQARDRVEAFKQRAQEQVDPQDHVEFEEVETQCQLLESRTLALEATVSSLPADWLVIQQIQAAGVATFQEVVTTASDRFNRIKMTLLALNGLLRVRGVQMIADKQRQLDDHLMAVRGDLMNQVVRTAAEAPGENRLRQAEQLKKVVEDTATMRRFVTEARSANAQKFEQARIIITNARTTLLAIAVEQPGKRLVEENNA